MRRIQGTALKRSSRSDGLERSVPIGTLTLVKEAADELSFDCEALFRSIGVEPGALRYPMTPIPLGVVGKTLSKAVADSGCEHFAALAGARARLDYAGLVPLLVMREKSVRDAITDFTRFLRIWYRGVHFVLHVEHGWAQFTVSIEGPCEGHAELCTSYTSSMNRHLEAIIPGRWRASRVLLSRPRPRDIGAYRRIFNAPVVFGAAADAIEFPAALLERTREVTDERLVTVLRQQLIGLEAVHRPTVVDQVRRLIEVLLVRGDCSVQRVAQLLSIHRQTLYRHLRGHDTTFEKELERARRQMAERMLAEGDLPIADIAQALGYKEPVNFTRAFKRWNGVPPGIWRRKGV